MFIGLGHTANLQDLSNLTGIPVRKLRYCLDHQLVPPEGWFVGDAEIGRQRRFNLDAAIYLVCAARLLIAGCKRDAVRRLLRSADLLGPQTHRKKIYLPHISGAIFGATPAVVDFGDDTHARWRVGGKDSGWMRLGRAPKADIDFEPTVVISLDFANVRKSLTGN
jgi:hypothetical protein